MMKIPSDAALIITYRCPMNCIMCRIHDHPSNKNEEIKPEVFEKLPQLDFINITGGEPFIRDDLEEIIKIVRKKAHRIIISTSGWFIESIITLFQKFPHLGIRVSLEGLSVENDELRGRKGSFDRGLYVLLMLKKMGIQDIGFGITISDRNAGEILKLYELAKSLDIQMATAAVHNSFYFHTSGNHFANPEKTSRYLDVLIDNLLKEKHPKSWFRAYFNYGLKNYIMGKRRLLPCQAGSLNFFIDPWGYVYPCNGLEERFWKEHMGNLAGAGSFEELWKSEKAEIVRKQVSECQKNCWMIGTVAPVMKRNITVPLKWIVKNKFFFNRKKRIMNQINRRMKILVTGTRGIPGIQGGIETHCEELYPRLAELGCSVTVTRRTPYVRDRLRTYRGVQLKNLYAPRSSQFEAFVHTLLSTFYAKWNGYNLIHIHGIGPSLLAPLARFLGLKVIVTNHGPDFKRQKWGKISRFILRLGELLGTIFAGKVIAVSLYIKRRLCTIYRRIDCIYLPNGVIIKNRVKEDDFLKKYDVIKNSYILAVGRFVPEKGFHDLIQSFSEMKQGNIKLVIAGDADYETDYSRKLKRDARKSGCILTGFIQKEKLAQLYSHARLFVLPSYHEGLPFSLLEAMSFGLDVLVSNIPAHRDIGLDQASYFKTGDVSDLTRRIDYKLTHPDTGLNRESIPAGRWSLLSAYNWDMIAQKTFELYKNLLLKY